MSEPTYPPPGSIFPAAIEYDIHSKFTAAFLGDIHIPTPSSMSEKPVVRGAMFNMPNGNVETQERFRGKELVWSWDGLNTHDKMYLESTINNAGVGIKQLFVPTYYGVVDWRVNFPEHICVKPNGLSPFDASVRWNEASKTARWSATMKWREVPGECEAV